MSECDGVKLKTSGTTPTSSCEGETSGISCPQMHSLGGCCQFPSPKPLWAKPTRIGSHKRQGKKAGHVDRASCLSIIPLLLVLGRYSMATVPDGSFPTTLVATWCILLHGASSVARGAITGESFGYMFKMQVQGAPRWLSLLGF